MYEDDYSTKSSGWSSLAPNLKADLILVLPFIFVDFFNYYSAGIALVISGPIMILLYLGSGVLCSVFALRQGRSRSQLPMLGALTGAGLWFASTLVNTLLGLLMGTLSLGTTILLGLPYLCLCAPFNLILGGAAGAVGALLYSRLFGRPNYEEF
jgi:hypothetical protein